MDDSDMASINRVMADFEAEVQRSPDGKITCKRANTFENRIRKAARADSFTYNDLIASSENGIVGRLEGNAQQLLAALNEIGTKLGQPPSSEYGEELKRCIEMRSQREARLREAVDRLRENR